jgi:hypothetical protein
MKKCIKCDIDITDRGPRFKYCLDCAKLAKKESMNRVLNKEEIKEKRIAYSKKYYNMNKERLKPIRKEWRKINSEKEKEYNKKRYESIDKERLSNYYNENKEEINKKKSEYRKTDEYKKWISEYRIKNAYKQRYRDSLKSVKRRLMRDKNDYTNNLLGYSDMEFKIHIENQFTEEMSWDDRKSFEIDHIIPIAAFKEDTPLCIVSSLDNLKPVNPQDNIRKYTSIDYNYVQLYEKYLDFIKDEYKEKILNYISSKSN